MSTIEQRIGELEGQIARAFHDALGFKEAQFKARFLPTSGTSTVRYDNQVLVFGLNPSSSDLELKGKLNPCFLHYVPDAWLAEEEKDLAVQWARGGFTYAKYFKKIYELFRPFGYGPVWTHPAYLDGERRRELGASCAVLDRLAQNNNTGRYCLVADLIPYKETVARRMEEVLMKNNELKTWVFERFTLELQLRKPKLVLINNAFGSRFLWEQMRERQPGTLNSLDSHVFWMGVPVVFTSLMSGARALDLFAYERLRKEIAGLLER